MKKYALIVSAFTVVVLASLLVFSALLANSFRSQAALSKAELTGVKIALEAERIENTLLRIEVGQEKLGRAFAQELLVATRQELTSEWVKAEVGLKLEKEKTERLKRLIEKLSASACEEAPSALPVDKGRVVHM